MLHFHKDSNQICGEMDLNGILKTSRLLMYSFVDTFIFDMTKLQAVSKQCAFQPAGEHMKITQFLV